MIVLLSAQKCVVFGALPQIQLVEAWYKCRRVVQV